MNVLLNLLMIPKYQAAGALIATIFAEGGVCIIQSLDAARHINIVKCLNENLYFMLSGITMLIIIRVVNIFVSINNSLLYLLLQILCGAFVYLLMLIIYYFFMTKILKRTISIK